MIRRFLVPFFILVTSNVAFSQTITAIENGVWWNSSFISNGNKVDSMDLARLHIAYVMGFLQGQMSIDKKYAAFNDIDRIVNGLNKLYAQDQNRIIPISVMITYVIEKQIQGEPDSSIDNRLERLRKGWESAH